MWPQPPVFSSTTTIWAGWPCHPDTSQFTQLSASASWPVTVRTTWPPTTRFTEVGGLAASPGYAWDPPPTSRLM
jgi:hypothetical protein